QIPVDVINECLMEPPTSIELFDINLNVSHHCVLKSMDEKTETLFAKGWYIFAVDRELSEGDVLHFKIKYPLVNRVEVKVRCVCFHVPYRSNIGQKFNNKKVHL
ncbi:hypothetical protein RYX36_003404, partial [Vicia faba]